MIKPSLLSVCVLGLLVSPSVFGHHSFSANFLMDEEVSIDAVVTSLRAANPHSLLFVDVVDDTGATEAWTIEMATPTRLRNAGWNSKTLPPGTRVTVVGHPTRSGAPTLALVKVVFEDGRELPAP